MLDAFRANSELNLDTHTPIWRRTVRVLELQDSARTQNRRQDGQERCKKNKNHRELRWTEDADFFGTGIAVWTTNRIEIFLKKQAKSVESQEE